MPLRAVVDTNESIRIAARDWSPIREAWAAGEFEWITSEALISEFIEVSSRVRVQRYLRPDRAGLFIDLLRSRAAFVIPETDTPPCRDPKDLMLIGTAIAGKADFLVTSDNDILDDAVLMSALEGYGIRAISAGQFETRMNKRAE